LETQEHLFAETPAQKPLLFIFYYVEQSGYCAGALIDKNRFLLMMTE